ncbi:hypothetical protein BG005_006764, partial [Podila minutissima]
MTEKHWTLLCVVEGETSSNAFPVEIELTKTISHLKKLIKTAKSPEFDDIVADKLKPIALNDCESPQKLEPLDSISDVFKETPPKKTIHVLVQRPPQELEWPFYKKKRIRNTEGWKQYTASDGKTIDLPPLWIDILASNEFAPAPRTAFNHLKNENDLRAGVAINVPNLGQIPKESGLHGQGHNLFVTEQMLELWEDMRGDKDRAYRRVLSGPMGVGKSYLSYFLAAKAYAEGWLVLYISDAGVLDTNAENESELEVIKRFLALNQDILTGAELEMLVNDYDGTYNISTDATSVIFGTLLKTSDRKTLLLVDEHEKLFRKKPYIPDKFTSLNPLQSYHWWGEEPKGSRVIFTGTAHAKFEMEILDDTIGPLSKNVFSNLLDTYPCLKALAIKEEVIEITNRVPRELVNLSAKVEELPDPISLDDLQKWTVIRTKEFLSTAKAYYESRSQFRKERLYKTLLDTFLGSTSAIDFEWEFIDLGLIYRSKD